MKNNFQPILTALANNGIYAGRNFYATHTVIGLCWSQQKTVDVELKCS